MLVCNLVLPQLWSPADSIGRAPITDTKPLLLSMDPTALQLLPAGAELFPHYYFRTALELLSLMGALEEVGKLPKTDPAIK